MHPVYIGTAILVIGLIIALQVFLKREKRYKIKYKLAMERKVWKEAVELAQKLCSIKPNNVEYHVMLAEAYEKEKLFSVARQIFEKLLQRKLFTRNWSEGKIRGKISYYLLEEGNVLNAFKEAYIASIKDPSFYLTHLVLGRLYGSQKKYDKAEKHLKKALELTRLLGGNKFGFHAGFFVDRPVGEIGKKFGRSDLYDREKALKNFTDGFHRLKDEFKDIDLYIENNCYSASNYQVYGNIAPFMLLNFQDYKELRKKIDFKLLLDIGHLLVSARTFGIDFKKEFQDMFKISDYIHISSNDSRHDQNFGLEKKSELVEILNSCEWDNKTVSLEIYKGYDTLIDTYSIVSSLKRSNS